MPHPSVSLFDDLDFLTHQSHLAGLDKSTRLDAVE